MDRYTVDFVTLKGKLIIEVDGATHSDASQVARDAERTRILEALGFHVLRVSNRDVYDNLDAVLDRVLSELGSL